MFENNDADLKYLVNKTLKDSKAENQCWMCVIVRPLRSTALTADSVLGVSARAQKRFQKSARHPHMQVKAAEKKPRDD